MKKHAQVSAGSGMKSPVCSDLIPALGWRWFRIGNGGFTLVELVVVFVTIGALAMLAIPAYNHFVEAARVTRTSSEIRALEKDIYAYFIDSSVLPDSLNDIGRGDLVDPWGNAYQYLNIDNGGVPRKDMFLNPLNTDFDLYSTGKNGASQPKISEPDSLDDILRAGDGGWVGSAGKYHL